MAKSTPDKIFDSAIDDHINILRLAENEKLIAEKLLIDLRKDIITQIVDKDPTGVTRTAFQDKRLKELYASVDEITSKNFDKLSKNNQQALIDMGNYEAGSSKAMIDNGVGLNVTAPKLSMNRIKSVVSKSMIDGKLMGDWWKKQDEDFVKRFEGTMNGIMNDFRSGALEGKALGQMISSMAAEGALMGYTRKNVEAMVRTSFMSVAADVREQTYKENEDILAGTKWVSTLDLRTCLTADNRILTPAGYKYVTDIKENDIVIGGLSGEHRKVTGVMETTTNKIAIVVLENGKQIKCTPDHRFLLTSGEWVEAQHLTSDMDIQERN